MIRSDYHIHSNFSSDARASMEDMIEKAINLDLQRICFTDHLDYDYPQIEDGYNFMLNIDEYFKKINEVKERYASKIEIYKGLELGLQPHISKKLNELVEKYDLDFIIGSTHVIDKLDPYYPDYWSKKKEDEGIIQYFQSIIDSCKSFQGFHVYGHLDYIVRYIPNISKPYPYEQYADIIDEVLKTIIDQGKGIEVNTSGYKYIFKHPHPRSEILQRYKEMGGEIITIGSDAHEPGYVGYSFNQASTLLQSLGYKYYTTFVKGKPQFHKFT